MSYMYDPFVADTQMHQKCLVVAKRIQHVQRLVLNFYFKVFVAISSFIF